LIISRGFFLLIIVSRPNLLIQKVRFIQKCSCRRNRRNTQTRIWHGKNIQVVRNKDKAGRRSSCYIQ